jgi:hypothetical protein
MCQAVCVVHMHSQTVTDSVLHVRHDTITRGNQYRRLYPIGLLCYQSAGLLAKQKIRTHILRIRSYRRSEEMASKPDASLSPDRLLYIAPYSTTLVLHLDI